MSRATKHIVVLYKREAHRSMVTPLAALHEHFTVTSVCDLKKRVSRNYNKFQASGIHNENGDWTKTLDLADAPLLIVQTACTNMCVLRFSLQVSAGRLCQSIEAAQFSTATHTRKKCVYAL